MNLTRVGVDLAKHVFQVHGIKRGLTHGQHQIFTLLEHDVSSPAKQIVRKSTGDGGERSHAAGNHGHDIGAE